MTLHKFIKLSLLIKYSFSSSNGYEVWADAELYKICWIQSVGTRCWALITTAAHGFFLCREQTSGNAMGRRGLIASALFLGLTGKSVAAETGADNVTPIYFGNGQVLSWLLLEWIDYHSWSQNRGDSVTFGTEQGLTLKFSLHSNISM